MEMDHRLKPPLHAPSHEPTMERIGAFSIAARSRGKREFAPRRGGEKSSRRSGSIAVRRSCGIDCGPATRTAYQFGPVTKVGGPGVMPSGTWTIPSKKLNSVALKLNPYQGYCLNQVVTSS